MSRLTQLDLWVWGKVSTWWGGWRDRGHRGRHRTDGMSTMQLVRQLQVSR